LATSGGGYGMATWTAPIWALLWLRASIDQDLFMAQYVDPERVDAQDVGRVEHLRELLTELRRYLVANRGSLANYGASYRRGERVATAHVDRP
jgi:hypothetical protein